MTTKKPAAAAKDKLAEAAPALPADITLGLELRCRVTGFRGVATQRTTLMSGNVQYALQPKAAEGATALPEAVNFDYHTLEVVGLGVVDAVTPIPAQALGHVQLGWKVEDVITKLKGVATQRVEFMNGCVYFQVVAERDPKELFKSDGFFEWSRLKPVGRDPEVKLPGLEAARKAEPKARPPGGPRAPVRRAT
jgi:hypothetical protein